MSHISYRPKSEREAHGARVARELAAFDRKPQTLPKPRSPSLFARIVAWWNSL